jgi:hypothetical protein
MLDKIVAKHKTRNILMLLNTQIIFPTQLLSPQQDNNVFKITAQMGAFLKIIVLKLTSYYEIFQLQHDEVSFSEGIVMTFSQ